MWVLRFLVQTMAFRIGVDIGGTNTDAVLVDSDGAIVRTHKTATTADIVGGFSTAINAVRENHEPVAAVFVGTTHALNALLEARNVLKVGLIRLAGYQPDSIPFGFGWPEPLKRAVLMGSKTVAGGYDCDGTAITPLCVDETRYAIEALVQGGAEGLAISGIFASIYPDQERQVRAWVIDMLGPQFPLTVSHDIGGVGYIERENATLLNTALQKSLRVGFTEIAKALRLAQLACPLYITQNNGTVMGLTQAVEFPVLTLAAGQKNSFVGAARLAGITDAVVADIGGTSTDVGIVENGFARRSCKTAEMAGVQLGFSMPDVLSIAQGGGSHLHIAGANIDIGPLSVGRRLMSEARAFGGPQLTLTDAAISCGALQVDGGHACIATDVAEVVLERAFTRVQRLYERMAGPRAALPLIIVGGGASLLPRRLLAANVVIPEHAACANAYGAALSEMSATVDRIIPLANRDRLLEEIEADALSKATQQGAIAPRIVERQILPYHYMPENIARVIVTAAGPVDPKALPIV